MKLKNVIAGVTLSLASLGVSHAHAAPSHVKVVPQTVGDQCQIDAEFSGQYHGAWAWCEDGLEPNWRMKLAVKLYRVSDGATVIRYGTNRFGGNWVTTDGHCTPQTLSTCPRSMAVWDHNLFVWISDYYVFEPI